MRAIVTRTSRVRHAVLGIVMAVAVVGSVVACSRVDTARSPSTSPVDAPSLAARGPASGGLSEADAIAIARTFEPNRDEAVWAAVPGTFETVYASLAHRPESEDQPPPDGIELDRLVWGIEFRVSLEICGPSGGECETRDGLRTVYIDHESGAWLRASAYAPNPGEALPRP